MKILENKIVKMLASKDYNYFFNKNTGFFMRWGKTKEDDPQFSPYGCEIADIEVSTVCSKGCKFCYKGNTAHGTNMSLDKFKQVMKALPPTLTQIAFGIGDIDGNPELEAIFKYTREHGIVPNVTINANNVTPEQYDMLAKYCGAVAVSLYDYDECYSAVAQLAKRGMKQVNIHCLLSHETYDRCMKVIEDATTDNRLVGNLNAIVFLHLKPKGRAVTNEFNIPTDKEFESVVNSALEHGIGFGFDSCSANKAMKYLPENLHNVIEPCESTLFSCYINVDGKAFPCSFAEDVYEGVDVTGRLGYNFWYSSEYKDFRKKCLICGRKCPIYKLGDGEQQNKLLQTQKDYEKFCDKMDKKYGLYGWEIVYQERI